MLVYIYIYTCMPVGALWWLVAVSPDLSVTGITEVCLCYLLAAGVDVDHFIAAGSVKLKVHVHVYLSCNIDKYNEYVIHVHCAWGGWLG